MLRVTLSGCQVLHLATIYPANKSAQTHPLQRQLILLSLLEPPRTHSAHFENVRKLCVTRSEGIILQKRPVPLSTHAGTFLEKIHDGSFT